MAYTLDDLAALEAGIAKGVLRVRQGDEEVWYRSLAEMERIRRQMREELGLTSTNRIVAPQPSNGWR